VVRNRRAVPPLRGGRKPCSAAPLGKDEGPLYSLHPGMMRTMKPLVHFFILPMALFLFFCSCTTKKNDADATINDSCVYVLVQDAAEGVSDLLEGLDIKKYSGSICSAQCITLCDQKVSCLNGTISASWRTHVMFPNGSEEVTYCNGTFDCDSGKCKDGASNPKNETCWSQLFDIFCEP
jgi:hypothetical protein